MGGEINLYTKNMTKPDIVSCGGIIYRIVNNRIEIVLLHRFQTKKWEHDSWHLPKGVQSLGETLKETALREIREETGYSVKIIEKIGELWSTYKEDGLEKNKLTHYFACTPIEKIGEPDQEHDEVVWIDLKKATSLVSGFLIWEKEEEVLKVFRNTKI